MNHLLIRTGFGNPVCSMRLSSVNFKGVIGNGFVSQHFSMETDILTA